MIPVTLTIAGSDSGGGAGIQADLKTFAALGTYGTSAITAVTAQNTLAVTAIHPVPPEIIIAQLDAIFADFAPAAIKIGMLGGSAAVAAVSAFFDRHGPQTIVLDPVMVATTGALLLPDDARDAFVHCLLSRARLVTPNLPEAAALTGRPIATDETEMIVQARAMLRVGAQAVLIKGGHGRGVESIDVLVDAAGTTRLSAPRLCVGELHGGGCTLSAAIAAGLARGKSLADAVGEAKSYVWDAMAAAPILGIGHGAIPLDHFYRTRNFG
jgi:hydroxymethylpyrimidine/phosphomethylpyrimidine kinase